jgi:hypothetical protein
LWPGSVFLVLIMPVLLFLHRHVLPWSSFINLIAFVKEFGLIYTIISLPEVAAWSRNFHWLLSLVLNYKVYLTQYRFLRKLFWSSSLKCCAKELFGKAQNTNHWFTQSDLSKDLESLRTFTTQITPCLCLSINGLSSLMFLAEPWLNSEGVMSNWSI